MRGQGELQAFLRDLEDLLGGSLAERDLFDPHTEGLRMAWAKAESRFAVVNGDASRLLSPRCS